MTVHVVTLVIELSQWLNLNTLMERIMMIIISKGIVYHIIAPNLYKKFHTKNQVHYLWPSSVGSGGALILPDPLANTKYFILDQKVLL